VESWRLVWRDGFVHSFSTKGLQRLLHLLREDSPKLLQGATTQPPPLMVVQDWPLEAADAVTVAAVDDFDCTVGEAEEAFAKACLEADQRLGEPAACRWFLNTWDDTPRPEMLRELTAEVELALRGRGVGCDELDPALKAAVEANPGDRTLRLAAADYYRELGDDETADRLQAEVAKSEVPL
jgi:uncharacterized protein (TIGR02996 family)